MPFYEYLCDECKCQFTKRLRISEYADPQACPECEHPHTSKIVTGCNFILAGDGWVGKNNRIAGQMRKKNQRLTKRQNDRYREAPTVTLAPNVGGERVDSWAEASKLAASQGKDTSGYEARAREEKK